MEEEADTSSIEVEDSSCFLDVELEALQSIYINETDVHRDDQSTTVSIDLHPATADNLHEQYVKMTLKLTLGDGYPEVIPEINIRNPRGLSDEKLTSITQDLIKIAESKKGNSMLFEIIEAAKDHLTKGNRPCEECAICLYGFHEDDVFTKTECYHYFHSHCLARYSNSSLQTNIKSELLCPVCRLPIQFEVSEESYPPPKKGDEQFVVTDAIVELQKKMSELFLQQVEKGGIIDLEVEKNKYLLTIAHVPTITDNSHETRLEDDESNSTITEVENVSATSVSGEFVKGEKQNSQCSYEKDASGTERVKIDNKGDRRYVKHDGGRTRNGKYGEERRNGRHEDDRRNFRDSKTDQGRNEKFRDRYENYDNSRNNNRYHNRFKSDRFGTERNVRYGDRRNNRYGGDRRTDTYDSDKRNEGNKRTDRYGGDKRNGNYDEGRNANCDDGKSEGHNSHRVDESCDDRRNDKPDNKRNDRQDYRRNERHDDMKNDRWVDGRNDRFNDRRNYRPEDRRNNRPNYRRSNQPIDRRNDQIDDRKTDRPDDKRYDRPDDKRNDQPDDKNDLPDDRENDLPKDTDNGLLDDREVDLPDEGRNDLPQERRNNRYDDRRNYRYDSSSKPVYHGDKRNGQFDANKRNYRRDGFRRNEQYDERKNYKFDGERRNRFWKNGSRRYENVKSESNKGNEQQAENDSIDAKEDEELSISPELEQEAGEVSHILHDATDAEAHVPAESLSEVKTEKLSVSNHPQDSEASSPSYGYKNKFSDRNSGARRRTDEQNYSKRNYRSDSNYSSGRRYNAQNGNSKYSNYHSQRKHSKSQSLENDAEDVDVGEISSCATAGEVTREDTVAELNTGENVDNFADVKYEAVDGSDGRFVRKNQRRGGSSNNERGYHRAGVNSYRNYREENSGREERFHNGGRNYRDYSHAKTGQNDFSKYPSRTSVKKYPPKKYGSDNYQNSSGDQDRNGSEAKNDPKPKETVVHDTVPLEESSNKSSKKVSSKVADVENAVPTSNFLPSMSAVAPPPGFQNPSRKIVYGLAAANPPPGFNRS